MEKKNRPLIVSSKEGKSVSVVGDTYRIVMSGKNTKGAFATIDMLIPPGGGPGPHSHSEFEESFYVIEGEVEFKSEFGGHTAGKGTFVNIPKGGVVHCFKNKSATTAHLLCTVVPAGLEEFFEAVGVAVEPDTFLPAPHMNEDAIKKLQGIAEKFGQKVFPPDYLDHAEEIHSK